MGVIMSYILRKWRGDMTATEENLLGFLREFPEFGKCVKFLEEYIKGNRCLQRSQSDANLLDKSDSSEALSGVLGGPSLDKDFLRWERY